MTRGGTTILRLLYGPPGEPDLRVCPEPLTPFLRRSADGKRRFWRCLLGRWGGFSRGEAAPRHAFGAYWRRRHWLQEREPVLRPVEAPPSHIERLLAALHAIEAAENRTAILREPTERPLEDYPPELEKKMERREPQFFLRNIPRAEKFLDDEEYDRIRTMDRAWVDELERVRKPRYVPPELLDEMNLERVIAYRRDNRQLFCYEDWTRYFGRELKRTINVAVWRYDPNVPPKEEEAGEEGLGPSTPGSARLPRRRSNRSAG